MSDEFSGWYSAPDHHLPSDLHPPRVCEQAMSQFDRLTSMGMSTDPRLAPLAAALRPYEMLDPWTDNLRTIVMAGAAEEVASAILAALPPDWCGHGAYEAELERNWSRDRAALGATEARENECERELAMLLAVNHAHGAEIARLRAIEEAARKYLACDGSGIRAPEPWTAPYDAMKMGRALDALRAALGSER